MGNRNSLQPMNRPEGITTVSENPSPEHRCCSCVSRRAITGTRRVHRPAFGEREREVLLAWLVGTTKESTARALYVSPHTVKTHIERVRDKYDAVGRPAPTKVALLLRAIEDGLIDVSDIRDDI